MYAVDDMFLEYSLPVATLASHVLESVGHCLLADSVALE